jgi:hypothetical protein
MTKTGTTMYPDDPPPAPPEAEARYRQLIEQATATWRGWAFAMAEGKPGPKPLELLQVGAVLGMRKPGEDLDEDCHTVIHLGRLRDAAHRLQAENPRLWPTTTTEGTQT